MGRESLEEVRKSDELSGKIEAVAGGRRAGAAVQATLTGSFIWILYTRINMMCTPEENWTPV